MTWAGAVLIGLPYAAALALIARIGELVSTLGPIIAAFPLIAVGRSTRRISSNARTRRSSGEWCRTRLETTKWSPGKGDPSAAPTWNSQFRVDTVFGLAYWIIDADGSIPMTPPGTETP